MANGWFRPIFDVQNVRLLTARPGANDRGWPTGDSRVCAGWRGEADVEADVRSPEVETDIERLSALP